MSPSKRDKFRQHIKETVDETTEITPHAEVTDERLAGTRRIKNARLIEIDKIKPDPDQPRKTFPEDSLAELSSSIKEHGVMQPITVEYQEHKGYYMIISGERRYQAAKLAGLLLIPCIIHDQVNKKDRYAKQLIENLQREDLSPIDKARALLEYKERLGKQSVWQDVEKTLGISETRRKQFISLLKLPEDMQKEIVAIGKRPSKNAVTEKHARALVLLNKYPQKQLELFELIKSSHQQITGDEAIVKAREIKGKDSALVFRVTYRSQQELIHILEQKLAELKQAQ